MLLQELQTLKKYIFRARENFIEQEKSLIGLEDLAQSKDYAALAEQLQGLQRTWSAMSQERAKLETDNEEFRQAVEHERRAIAAVEPEVQELEARVREHNQQRSTLQERLADARRIVERSREAGDELVAELEEMAVKVSRQKAMIEMVNVEAAGWSTQLHFLSVAHGQPVKKKKAPVWGRRDTSKASRATSNGKPPKTPVLKSPKEHGTQELESLAAGGDEREPPHDPARKSPISMGVSFG